MPKHIDILRYKDIEIIRYHYIDDILYKYKRSSDPKIVLEVIKKSIEFGYKSIDYSNKSKTLDKSD
jgi:hypothetical protein